MHPSADRVAWAWIVGGAGWTATALLGLGASLGSGRFYAAEVAWMAIHVAVFIGIVGLLRSPAVGDSVWARRGLGVAAVGVAMRMAELNVSQDRPLGADDHKTGTISVTPYENVRP